jgi:hypothetical protein
MISKFLSLAVPLISLSRQVDIQEQYPRDEEEKFDEVIC